jgi:signal transduction histidine kinase
MDAPETSLFTAVLIICFVVGVIIIYFIVSIVRQQRKNLQLNRENIMAEITAMEKERARIAADLHDELGPMLAAVKLKINSFELTDEDDIKEIERTNEHIDGLIRRMREISYDLLPGMLTRKGLVQAILQFVEYTRNANTLDIELELSQSPINIDEQRSIHLFRIVQEIIHNTIKHSQASKLKIMLHERKGLLILSTSDDGQGFDYHAVSKSEKGIGLRSLLSRTEMIGGVMYIESVLNKGTEYSFEIPLKKNE